MGDIILVEGLELSAHIGVTDEERSAAQRVTVNLVLEPTRGFAMLGDDLANSVDYLAVSRAVQALAREHPRQLIETLAQDIAALLLARFPLRSAVVELRKYILPDTEFVAVRLRRERSTPS